MLWVIGFLFMELVILILGDVKVLYYFLLLCFKKEYYCKKFYFYYYYTVTTTPIRIVDILRYISIRK